MPRRITEKTELVPAAQYLGCPRSISSTPLSINELQSRSSPPKRLHRRPHLRRLRQKRTGDQTTGGLQQLLHDVTSYSVAFGAILVYDVSRWGRFQDTTRPHITNLSAEAPAFPSTIAPSTSRMTSTVSARSCKGPKRGMAAEYSRELSIQGARGTEAIGLKWISCRWDPWLWSTSIGGIKDGTARRILTRREFKPFVRDRVKLVLGPPREVAVVRHIYRTFLQGTREDWLFRHRERVESMW